MTPDEIEDMEQYRRTAHARTQVTTWCLRILLGLLVLSILLAELAG